MKKTGLTNKQLEEIIAVLKTVPEIEKAVLFGSRATGTYKKTSDVDIALSGKRLEPTMVRKAHMILEEGTSIPYFFDLLHAQKVRNKELARRIREEGLVIYSRDN